jgi:hypothetical protein
LEIRLESLPSQREDLALSYANIRLVHEDKEDLKQALTYFQRATDIIRNILPSDHPKAIRIENDFRRVSSVINFHSWKKRERLGDCILFIPHLHIHSQPHPQVRSNLPIEIKHIEQHSHCLFPRNFLDFLGWMSEETS